jgi:uncharacterized membrane protein (DUF4010 family)
LPNWVAVGTTVAAVLLLTGRERLHELARRVEMKEIITAGQFLILTGLVLPLLPSEPVTTLTSLTPRQVWFALLVVCTLSYASYLAQHYWAPAAGGLWMAALGGLYSSTATTVVLARQAGIDASLQRHAQAGITLATGIMYLRILAIVAVFNLAVARQLVVPLVGLSVAAMLICALQYWFWRPPRTEAERKPISQNPLELGAAGISQLCSSSPHYFPHGSRPSLALPASIGSLPSSGSLISTPSFSTSRKEALREFPTAQ